MVCLGLMMITTPDYSYAVLCHALVGLSYGLCFGLTLCYVTVGTFARRGLSSTAKTLRSLSGGRGS